jgi:hypothetical protein
MDSSKQERAALGATAGQEIRLISTHAADVKVVTNAAGHAAGVIGKKFIESIKELEERAEAIIFFCHKQFGTEPSCTQPEIDFADGTVSMTIYVGGDLPDGEVDGLMHAIYEPIVPIQTEGTLTSDTAAVFEPNEEVLEAIPQATHATLKKRGGGAIKTPHALLYRGREVLRAEGNYLPARDFSDPRPEEREYTAHINGWKRKRGRRAFLDLDIAGKLKPQSITANYKTHELGCSLAELSVDHENKGIVRLKVTRDRNNVRRYELLFVRKA